MLRETKTLEYKENMQSGTFMKTVSAYANYGDGQIIFGVRDNGEVVGIDDPVAASLNLENKINDSMNPVPEYSIEIEESLVKLWVYEGKYKPYLYKGKAYKRNDSATIEVGRLEYNRLVLEGRDQSFEELTSKEQELSFHDLEQRLIRIMGIQELNKDILKTLELFTDSYGFNNAAALLADQNVFPGIDIIRFGKDIDEIMERKTFENRSILEELDCCMEMFQTYYQYEKIEETERKIVEKIPEKAFREAIANALVHRVWDVRAAIKVSMYEERIEISSPGGLPAGIGREEYLHGQISILRNPIIGNVFFRLKIIEKFGTGIMRINYAYEDALCKPDYQVFENSIKVVLPVIEKTPNLTIEEKSILDVLKKEDVLTRKQIERQTSLGRDKSIRVLNSLIEKRMIEKLGAGRGVKYRCR